MAENKEELLLAHIERFRTAADQYLPNIEDRKTTTLGELIRLIQGKDPVASRALSENAGSKHLDRTVGELLKVFEDMEKSIRRHLARTLKRPPSGGHDETVLGN